MYIALVCPYDLRRPGGVRSHIAGLGRALVERGHRVDVIAPSDATDLEGLPVVTCGRSRGLEFGGTQIDATWASWGDIAATARRGYDVAHFHTIWNPVMPFQLASAYRGPKVATFHDVAGPDTPTLARAVMAPAAAVIRGMWLKRVIAVSPVVSSYLGRDTHVVIPNGVSVPAALPPEGARDAVLFVGRLEPRKGVETLIDAAAALGTDCPPIWIAGDGPLRGDLERRAMAVTPSRVSFLGEVSEAEKWTRLRGAALLVAPSVGGESFGIVLLEAMAAGAIPIATDIPGYRDVLRPHADALLFPRGDAHALAERIRATRRDTLLRETIRTWSDSYWPQFAWPVIAERVERVYHEAISN